MRTGRTSLALPPHDHAAGPLGHLLHGQLPVPVEVALRLKRPHLVQLGEGGGGGGQRVAGESGAGLRRQDPAVDLVLVVVHRGGLEPFGRGLR